MALLSSFAVLDPSYPLRIYGVVRAFIFPRLDFCNAVYKGITQTAFCHLQVVQNAAARRYHQFKNARKRDHITPVLNFNESLDFQGFRSPSL